MSGRPSDPPNVGYVSKIVFTGITHVWAPEIQDGLREEHILHYQIRCRGLVQDFESVFGSRRPVGEAKIVTDHLDSLWRWKSERERGVS